jgi:hypothetical protein
VQRTRRQEGVRGVPGGGGRSGAAVAVHRVHGGQVRREGVPAAGLKGPQGRVQAGAEGAAGSPATAAAAATAEPGLAAVDGHNTFLGWVRGVVDNGHGRNASFWGGLMHHAS